MSAKKVRSSSTRSEVNQQQLFQSILVKFLINLPKEELDDSIRRAYHYQKAYYYFIDFICKDLSLSPQLRKLTNKDFFDKLNQYAGSTLPKKSKGEDIMILLKQNRPTCGAIIMNERGDKVLITSSCGKLGFPKGGKNENQSASKCAARQVKQQVGLFIHDKISEQNKIQFMYRGVKVTYFIVQNFDENEKLKIDENEIDQAYWMRVSEVSKNIHLLTEKNRLGWKEFQMISIIQPKLTMQDFLNTYREKNSRKEKNKEEEIFNENPLLNFKFNREKLFAVFTV